MPCSGRSSRAWTWSTRSAPCPPAGATCPSSRSPSSKPPWRNDMSKFVELTTNKGTIRLELDDAKAPDSVSNFLSYVEKGHYDNTIFHRVIKGFMIQGGGFEPGLKQKPTDAPIKN